MKKSGFLKVYLIVMILATLVGGYLVYSSRSQYFKSKQAFESSKAKLKALKASKIYPDSGNLKKKENQVAGYVEAVGKLKSKVLENQAKLNSEFTEQNFTCHYGGSGLTFQAQVVRKIALPIRAA